MRANLIAVVITVALATCELSACGGGDGDSTPPMNVPPFASIPLVRVSSTSTLTTGCNGAQTGTLYPNAEVEPFVALNPISPSHLIGMWQQDRWSNGGAQGLIVAASFDSGQSWTLSSLPFSRCTGGSVANGGDFDRATDPLFDPIAAARASATITLHSLLHPARAARLIRNHAENGSNPSLEEVATALADRLVANAGEGYEGAVLRAVRDVAISQLMEVSSGPAVDSSVRAVYESTLRDLARRLRATRGSGVEAAARTSDAARIERFLARELTPVAPVPPPEIPPGPPI